MRYQPTRVERMEVRAVRIPTDAHESDGTLSWDGTTCVIVRVHNNGTSGIGYTYSHESVADLIDAKLGPVVNGSDAMAPERTWGRMLDAVRNLGRQGLAAHAISAVDIALWDLKAKILGLPLTDLWGRLRHGVPAYGSGGFTSYGESELHEQLGRWVDRGLRAVKIKVGRHPEKDMERVRAARDIVGPDVALFVDANGAYGRKQALHQAERFREQGVEWLEEPVSSDDLEGLRLLRDRGPAGMAIAAGEYGYHPYDFRRLLESGAVDVLQADATRCLGFTGFRKVAALCEAWGIPLSAHTAPAVHAHVGLCCAPVVHMEYFHDHARCEERLFQGTPILEDGALVVGGSVPGMGLEVIERATRRFAA